MLSSTTDNLTFEECVRLLRLFLSIALRIPTVHDLRFRTQQNKFRSG